MLTGVILLITGNSGFRGLHFTAKKTEAERGGILGTATHKHVPNSHIFKNPPLKPILLLALALNFAFLHKRKLHTFLEELSV